VSTIVSAQSQPVCGTIAGEELYRNNDVIVILSNLSMVVFNRHGRRIQNQPLGIKNIILFPFCKADFSRSLLRVCPNFLAVLFPVIPAKAGMTEGRWPFPGHQKI